MYSYMLLTVRQCRDKADGASLLSQAQDKSSIIEKQQQELKSKIQDVKSLENKLNEEHAEKLKSLQNSQDIVQSEARAAKQAKDQAKAECIKAAEVILFRRLLHFVYYISRVCVHSGIVLTCWKTWMPYCDRVAASFISWSQSQQFSNCNLR